VNRIGDGGELNLLVEDPHQRVGRRGFLRVAALLGVAGGAGGAAGWLAGGLAGRASREDNPQDNARAGAAGPRRRQQTLNIYNWSDYIDEVTIPRFQALFNTRVNYDVYSSNEDLLAKMRAGPTQYDIIVPTNQFIPTYRRLGLLQPLRQDLIPNLVNLDRAFVETDYDPGNKYTIPWQWGTTGIGYNTKRIPGKVDSWTALYEPNKSLGGRISILREVTDLIGCTLIYLGKNPNSTKDGDLQQVVRTFKDLRRKVKQLKFSSDTYIDQLASGETWLAHGWSGDVFQARGDNADISYVIPKEGSLQWADVMCVPKDAPHPDNAARFMNYVLHPKTAARISKYVSYGTPVPLAKALLPPEQLNDPGIYPPSSIKLSFLTLTDERIKKLQGAYNAIVSG
jgi:spermidine/putrescine-binding protein